MIHNKKDLRNYLIADREALGLKDKNIIIEYFKGNLNDVMIWQFIKKLRKYEYYCNKYSNCKNIMTAICYIYHKHLYKRLCLQKNIFISPNVFGPGLRIVHPGYIWVDTSSIIGNNCTILPRVLLGKKKTGIPTPNIYIGDNCYVGTGSTILGPCRIGNNVTIGANSLVVHDIPDNAVVAGVPAKIIRMKNI